MEIGVQVLVAIAALLFIVDKVMTTIGGTAFRFYQMAANNRLQAIDRIHEESREEIQVPFELWWEDGPKQKATEELRTKTLQESGLEHLPMEIPAELIDMMIAANSEMMLDHLRELALHLAMHAHMGDADLAMLNRAPKFRGIRQNMLRSREEHQEELEAQRSMLLDYGVNPTDLESYFAKQA